MYHTQIGLAAQFQEPISLEQWAAGQTHSPPVNVSNIDRVPVSIVVPVADEVCDPALSEWIYTEI